MNMQRFEGREMISSGSSVEIRNWFKQTNKQTKTFIENLRLLLRSFCN